MFLYETNRSVSNSKQNSRFQTVQVTKKRFSCPAEEVLALRVLGCPNHPRLGRNNEGGHFLRRDPLSDLPGVEAAHESRRDRFAPRTINLLERLPEPLVERRHFQGEIIERTSLNKLSVIQFVIQALPKNPLQIANRVVGASERIRPARFQPRLNDLPGHGIPEIILVFEMMEERTLGRPGVVDNPVDAPGLKAGSVKLGKSSLENFLAGLLRAAERIGFHRSPSIQTSRYVVKWIFEKLFVPAAPALILEQEDLPERIVM